VACGIDLAREALGARRALCGGSSSDGGVHRRLAVGMAEEALAERRDVTVVVSEAPGDLHLGRDGAHHVDAREEGDLVDGVAVGGVAHRNREVAIGVERDRDGAQLDRHVARDGRDDLGRQARERVGVDLRDEQPGAVEVGQLIVGDGLGDDELLAERAALAGDARACVFKGVGRDQPRANQ
jgi:hypothetical protein